MSDTFIANIEHEPTYIIVATCIHSKEQVKLFSFSEFSLHLVYHFQALSSIEGFDIYNYETGNNSTHSFLPKTIHWNHDFSNI